MIGQFFNIHVSDTYLDLGAPLHLTLISWREKVDVASSSQNDDAVCGVGEPFERQQRVEGLHHHVTHVDDELLGVVVVVQDGA